jgi:hypothetical protein
MTVEAAVSVAMTADESLAAWFPNREPEEWWFAASSLGIGENPPLPPTPYIVWNELESIPQHVVRKTSDAMWRIFTFYVYDEMGDFTRINQIMREIRRITKAMAPFVAPDGTRVSESRWDAISGNISDQGYSQNVRFGTARFMASQ